jgi:hypothetical protein
MFNLLIIAACRTGMTSQVIEFSSGQERSVAARNIQSASSDIGEILCICL